MVSRLEIHVEGHDSFSRASEALGAANDELAVRVPQEAVLLARRLAAIAKRRILEEPTHGLKQRDLRATISEGVNVRENAPGDAIITTSMPVPNEAELPRGTDEPIRGWRHPVFGNRNNWVHQSDAFSWFMDSMQSGKDDGQRDLEDMLQHAADQIVAATR